MGNLYDRYTGQIDGQVVKKTRVMVGGVFILALVIRLSGIGTFMTVDEEQWMLRSGEFYHKLFDKKDPGGTFTTTHPGATVQWLAGAGIYGQEKRLGIGIDTSNLAQFRLASTVPVAVAIALMIAVVVYLAARLFGYMVAGWAGLLLATEPYLVGMGQVVHVDMLLALFMLAATLCLLIYTDERQWRWLAGTGIMMGLAFGTKLFPALWLLIIGAAILKGAYSWLMPAIWQRDGERFWRETRAVLREYMFFVGIAVITLYLVWPAMWVKTNLDDYYKRDVVSVATKEHVALAETEEPIEPLSFYGRAVLGRTTPLVLFITIGMAVGLLRYWGQEIVGRHVAGRLARHGGTEKPDVYITGRMIGWLLLYGVGYLVVISLLAKKADRYALPALVVMPIITAAGLMIASKVMKDRMKLFKGRVVKSAGWLVAGALILQPIGWMPYNIAYNNDWFDVRPLSQQGWGEGLDEAARWLNERTLGDRLMVATWYPGVLGTYFKGKTMSLSSRDDDRVGYIVIYRNMQGRGLDNIATSVLDEYKNRTPEYVVKISGKEYAWVYNVIGLSYFNNNVGELYGDMEIGQTIKAPANWQEVAIGMANFSGRKNTADVILHVRNKINDTEDVRTVTVPANMVEDRSWHKFNFEPLKNKAGQEYYVALTSPESRPGDAITVLYSTVDLLAGHMVWQKDALGQGIDNDGWGRENFDMAYRISQLAH